MTLAERTIEARIADHAYRIALEEKLTERWAWRSWYRKVARPMFQGRWDDLAAQNTADLRALVRQLRRVRGRNR